MITPHHVSHVTYHVSYVTCLFFIFIYYSFFLAKWWSYLVEGLLSKGPTPSSFSSFQCINEEALILYSQPLPYSMRNISFAPTHNYIPFSNQDLWMVLLPLPNSTLITFSLNRPLARGHLQPSSLSYLGTQELCCELEITALFTIHTGHCKLDTGHRKLDTANWTLTSADCTLHTADCRLHTAHCTLHTADCRLQTADCTLHTALCTLHTTHFYIAHYTLYTSHFLMHTAHKIFNTSQLITLYIADSL